jgi:hypothetical protein
LQFAVPGQTAGPHVLVGAVVLQDDPQLFVAVLRLPHVFVVEQFLFCTLLVVQDDPHAETMFVIK